MFPKGQLWIRRRANDLVDAAILFSVTARDDWSPRAQVRFTRVYDWRNNCIESFKPDNNQIPKPIEGTIVEDLGTLVFFVVLAGTGLQPSRTVPRLIWGGSEWCPSIEAQRDGAW